MATFFPTGHSVRQRLKFSAAKLSCIWAAMAAAGKCLMKTARCSTRAFGRPGDKPHIENFLQCVRSGTRPNGDVEQGYQSVLLCHLANAAWRAGNAKLAFDAS